MKASVINHARGYADPERIRRHKAIIRQRRADGTTWVATGITRGREAA